jgi:hypothetical protein
VRRAGDHLKGVPGEHLAAHTPADVTGYLERPGGLGRIADWQFVQIVDAGRSLLVTALALVVGAVDWASSRG